MQRAAVLLDRLPRDCKAEAGAGRLRREIRVEDPRQKLRRHARAVILHRNDDFGVDRLAAETYFASWSGLKRIFDQVGDRAAKHASIAGKLRGRRRRDFRVEIDSALPAGGVAGGDVLEQLANIDRLLPDLADRR